MPDPRRSNRAKATNPPGTLQHSNTASSNSSNKADRNTRTIPRQDSNTASMTPRSSPSNTPPSEPETRQTRQKKRELGVQEDEDTKDADNGADENVEDEDATRCVCGEQEYPGVPIPVADWAKSQSKEPPTAAGRTAQIDDPGGFFVQCDDCQVWQHAGCVGIMTEEYCPDNYYCEECRRNLHQLMTNPEGQRYSKYLPVYETIPSTSRTARKPSTSKDQQAKNAKDSRADSAAAKRRSTMNSRAAWEEEESFRRAVEASKTDDSVAGAPVRKPKRRREESEESEQEAKRPRAVWPFESGDSTPLYHASLTPPREGDESDEAPTSKGRINGVSRKARGANVQEQREKELRDKDKDKERERVEAANKRKERAGKRHADEPEPPEENGRPSSSARAATRPARGTKASPTADAPVNNASGPKKNARPTTTRRRPGRNQHSKDKDGNNETVTGSPRGSNSRDSDQGGSDGQGNVLANGSKPSKPRYMNPSRTSMNDLRKRAAGILEYISKTQVEMAGGDKTPPSGEDQAGDTKKVNVANGSSKLSNELSGLKEAVANKELAVMDGTRVDEDSFKGMSSLEMMDVLSRELVHWQQDHGKFGEKADK